MESIKLGSVISCIRVCCTGAVSFVDVRLTSSEFLLRGTIFTGRDASRSLVRSVIIRIITASARGLRSNCVM